MHILIKSSQDMKHMKIICWKNSHTSPQPPCFCNYSFWKLNAHTLLFLRPCPWDSPGKSTGVGCGRAWWAAVHGVVKSWTRLSDFTFTFHFYALEKEMATHFSVLAWRILGTGEPGGLLSMGSHRVGHDWSVLAAAAAAAAADTSRE